jgi:cytochrome P450
MCIGADFAMIEAQLVLAAVAQRYSLDLVPGHPVELDPLVTLRPRQGMMLRLRRRSGNEDPVATIRPEPVEGRTGGTPR